MESTYRITNRPAGTRFVSYDCHRCEHEGLKNPVFLEDTTGNTSSFGTHCAAVLLGLVPETATRSEAEKAIKTARQQKADKARQDEDELWKAFLSETGHTPGLAAMAAFNEWKKEAA